MPSNYTSRTDIAVYKEQLFDYMDLRKAMYL